MLFSHLPAVRFHFPGWRLESVDMCSAFGAVKSNPVDGLQATALSFNVQCSCSAGTGVLCYGERRRENSAEPDGNAHCCNDATHRLLEWLGSTRQSCRCRDGKDWFQICQEPYSHSDLTTKGPRAAAKLPTVADGVCPMPDNR
jgi:hypothetical protein